MLTEWRIFNDGVHPKLKNAAERRKKFFEGKTMM